MIGVDEALVGGDGGWPWHVPVFIGYLRECCRAELRCAHVALCLERCRVLELR